MSNKIVKSKRSQEEMVGFAVIVVLVVVIALVFLGISVRKPVEMRTSVEITDFLYSSFLYTISCNQQTENINDLIISCYRNENCDNGNSCQLLENTYKGMIEKSINLDGRYKAYSFKIFSSNQNLVSLEKGNSTGNSLGASVKVITSQEAVNVTLRLYS